MWRCSGIMLESDAWSDPQSELTEELEVAPSKPAGGLNRASLGMDSAPARQRCVVPRVQPSQVNGSDQRVPEYWDQTVPVWHAASTTTTKRKSSASASTSHRDRFGELGRAAARWFEGDDGAASDTAASEENSGESNSNGGCSSGRSAGGAGHYSEVSFDAILAMYESSLVEKSFNPSRRDGWVLGALAVTPRHDHARRRLWPRRTFAGRRPFPHLVSRAVELSPSRPPMIGALQVESVRRLQVAIAQTRICDPTSSPSCNNSHCKLESATFRGRRRSCDFQTHQLDTLSFSTPMLTTSSS